MNGQTAPNEDPVIRILSRRPADEVPARDGPCPEGELLAGLIEGRLLDGERTAIEAHLVRCEECRDAVAILAAGSGMASVDGEASAGATPAPAVPFRRAWLPRAAIAAGILTVAGVVTWGLLTRNGDGEGNGEPGVDARLVAAAEDLRRTTPELFSGFRPLDSRERAKLPPVLRATGPVRLLLPAGTILSTRPKFYFEAERETVSRELVLLTDQGLPVWKRTVSGARVVLLTYPVEEKPLEPGSTYHYGIDGEAGSFRVATESDRLDHERRMVAIDAACPAALRGLMKAHVALRHDLFVEAEKAVREHLQGSPDDPVGQETLRHVLRRLGAAEGG